MKTRLASLLSASFLACALASSAVAQSLITNGSFELNPATGFPTNVSSSSENTSLVTGWTLASSSSTNFTIADHTIGSGLFPYAADGSNYLAFSVGDANPTGFIFQDFATSVGATYQVSFAVGRAGASGGLVGLQADIFNFTGATTNSGTALGTFTSSNSVAGTTFFETPSFSFVATGATSRIVFTDISADFAYGTDVLLDNVSVTMTAAAIPEPSTYAAMFGACALGFAMYRRHQKSKTVAAPATVA